jgi:hypothetical protein
MVENERVRENFRRILEEQPDIGNGKIISNWFFAPPNAFEPKRRPRPKPGVAIALVYIALMAVICTVCNFR